MLDVQKIRQDFPILQKLINGKPLIYLDSTASTLKPKQVIDAVSNYYQSYGVNIFRGVYKLSEKATTEYEKARERVADFIGADNAREIIFTRNATEAINLVCSSWGGANIDKNSEMVTTIMEHHANLVPWQQLALKKGAKLKFLDINNEGVLATDDIEKNINSRTKLFALTYVSNVLGTVNPLKQIISIVKRKNPHTIIMIDAAQAIPHIKVNVKELGCDFLAFSGHKMLGPTGIGVLWGRYGILDMMAPYQMGGDMIKEVYLEKTIFNKAPHRFEAGTPHIAGAIGLAKAVDYLQAIGMGRVEKYEKELLRYALKKIGEIKKLKIYGSKSINNRGAILTFNIPGIHPHDMAQILDMDNICIRSGHHCAMPLHTRLNINSSCRASFYIYNTKSDIDKLAVAIERAKKVFKL